MRRQCLVIMPFHAALSGVWETVVRPTVLAGGDACRRADDLYEPGPVMGRLLRMIREADYLIADLTGRNPNVFYELGYAQALGKKTILLTQDLEDVPFDLRHQRVIEYSDTVAGADRLRTLLQRYLAQLAHESSAE